jgi:uncharacterized membrane protein
VSFAHPLPSWAFVAVIALAAWLAVTAYARARTRLTSRQRATLTGLRCFALIGIVLFLMQPVRLLPSSATPGRIVALVVDTSRSMNLRDTDSGTRLEEAAAVAARDVAPRLQSKFRVDTWSAGDQVTAASLDRLVATGHGTDLDGAVRQIEERYRGRDLAGIVLLSDGGETRSDASAARPASSVPIVTVGIGASDVKRDREIRSVTVGPSALDASLVDITTTLVSHGDPHRARVRLLRGGRLIATRDVDLPSNGAPMPQVFQVPADRAGAAVYRVEVDEVEGELTPGNTRADVLVRAPGRPRRVLMLEGAPGFEHTFLKRAWQLDPSLEVDAVVRKGRNDQGHETYYVQAAAARTAPLTNGFPATREALFAYDAIVLANVSADALTRDQLALLTDFVGIRGGGLLVVGQQSFGRGVTGTPLEPVLPVEVGARSSGVLRAANRASTERLKPALTDDGAIHPVMRIAADVDAVRKRWEALPALADAAPLGTPRPGAAVLAITTTGTGATVPLVAVQRFGRGRSMSFGGEASWRWRMMRPASDDAYDVFWRQAVRWLGGETPEPIAVTSDEMVPVGAPFAVDVAARTPGFEPLPGASAEVTVAAPSGEEHVAPVHVGEDPSKLSSTFTPSEPGVYRVRATVRGAGGETAGIAEQLVLAGGMDPELVDPRLNEAVLRRLADGSGGQYATVATARAALDAFARARAQTPPPQVRDLWHNAWSFLLIVALLSIEWVLRRQWGLR